MTTLGANLIAGTPSTRGEPMVQAVDPRTGEPAGPGVHEAVPEEVRAACEAAERAGAQLAAASPGERALLLDTIAAALERHGEPIVAAADRETALGTGRLESELARTTGQLRFLGDVVRDGAFLEATIDHDPDTRRVNVPIGPVAVFGASNFPLAFSVAGGDTAAALAAGCPVVVKAHPSHPATSELVGRAIADAVADAGVDGGAFSLLHGFDAGRSLVLDPRIRAVAFTGSTAGGTALARLAADRDDPIPVYAEMGSLNPVVVTGGALDDRADEILDGWVASFTLGAGQFCTKPGLLLVPADRLDELHAGLRPRLASVAPAPLLSAGILDSWRRRTDDWARGRPVVRSGRSGPDDGLWSSAVVVQTTAGEVAERPDLREECFGPTALLVGWDDEPELLRALRTLPGSLTAAIHAGPGEADLVRRLHDVLTPRVGRLIHDGWPTGVAVDWAMHHGGPWPATADGMHTSVGARALARFLRPVCYQDVAETFLPPALQDGNPWDVPRRVDGRLTI